MSADPRKPRKPLTRRTPLRPGQPMARGAGLARGAPLERSGPVRKRNPGRRSSEFKRCYHSKARVRFVGSLPCAADGVLEPGIPSDNAHTENEGMGRKGHYTTICPLCPRCHHRQHQAGWSAIAMTEESRRRAAENTELSWLAHLAARVGDPTDDDG